MELVTFDTEEHATDREAWVAFKAMVQSKEYKIENYFETLFTLRKELVIDTKMNSNKVVAEQINIGETQFSYIVKILKAEK